MSDAAEARLEPAADFAQYIVTSLVKDAFYKVASDGSHLVRQDMGAAAVVQVRIVGASADATPESAAAAASRIEASLKDFITAASGNVRKQAVSYYIIFVTENRRRQSAVIDRVLNEAQLMIDSRCIIADLIVVDMATSSYSCVAARNINDRKLRTVLGDCVKVASLSSEERANLREQAAKDYRQIRNDMAPNIKRRGPNPIMFLIVANVLIFLGGLFMEFRTGVDVFVQYGIQDNELIRQGEVWRLITPMFLHADIAHLGGNMVCLFLLGQALYRYYSNGELWMLYLLSGFFGNLAGFFFTNDLSLGASGAIMGLGGVLIYRMIIGKSARAFRHAGNYVMLAMMIAYNLVHGLFTENIDNYGHFGGFLAGFALAHLVALIREHREQQSKVT